MRQYSKDLSFHWARANPHVARKALEQPAFTNDSPSLAISYECFWKERKWNLPNQYAEHLVTHVLTHPLTLAHYIRKMMHFSSMKSMHWCCVGARNESTLPHQYWKELLVSLPRFSSLTLEFLGPEMSPQLPQTLTLNGSTLYLLWSQQKVFHQAELKSSWSAYVLFNPGLGHPNLKRSWDRSLDILIKQERPVLLTAHSKLDADRDTKVLQERLSTSILYTENPFASRIRFNDPISNEEHLVSSNQYACLIDFSTSIPPAM